MEMVLKGCPWLFRRQLILFDQLISSIDGRKIRVINSPLWIKIGLYPPECDKKDMMHAIGSTFRGVLCSKIKGDFCHLRVNLDLQKPLRRRIFISVEGNENVWVAFKYENLSTFCVECGRMGNGVKYCDRISTKDKEKADDKLLRSITLKAESNLIGKESLGFSYSFKKIYKSTLLYR